MHVWRYILIASWGLFIGTSSSWAQVVLLVTEPINNTILKFTGLAAGGSPTTFQNGIPGGVNMTSPAGLAADANGNVYVSAVQNFTLPNGHILRFNGSTGTYIDRFVNIGSGNLGNPNGIAFGPGGDLFVTNPTGDGTVDANTIKRYSGTTGAPVGSNGTFVTSGSGGLDLPFSAKWNNSNTFLLVSSLSNNQILRYTSTGAFDSVFAGGANVSSPTGLTFGPDGNLYVSMSSGTNANTVKRFDGTTGAFLGDFVSAGSGGLDGPGGLAFGPDNNLYVLSQNSGDILRYHGTTGAFLDVYASGLSFPQELLFLAAVPEPSTWAMILVTLAGIGAYFGFRHKPLLQPMEDVPSQE